jgi:hypothetical protein
MAQAKPAQARTFRAPFSMPVDTVQLGETTFVAVAPGRVVGVIVGCRVLVMVAAAGGAGEFWTSPAISAGGAVSVQASEASSISTARPLSIRLLIFVPRIVFRHQVITFQLAIPTGDHVTYTLHTTQSLYNFFEILRVLLPAFDHTRYGHIFGDFKIPTTNFDSFCTHFL